MSEKGVSCQKVNKVAFYTDQKPLMYLKLREQGCVKKKAMRFCQRTLCKVDTTQSNLGPTDNKCIRVITHKYNGQNGWESTATAEFDCGDGFKTFQQIHEDETPAEKKIACKYIQRENQLESKLKEKISQIEGYLSHLKNFRLKQDESSRQEFFSRVNTLRKQLQDQKDSPQKYLTLNGKKYLYVVDEIEEDMPKQRLFRKIHFSPEGQPYDRKLSLMTQPTTDAHPPKDISDPSTLKFFKNQSTTITQTCETPKSVSSRDPNDLPVVEDLKEETFRQLNMKEHLEKLMTPFKPVYNLDPKEIKIRFNHNRTKSQQIKVRPQNHIKTLTDFGNEGDVVQAILEQKGLQYCFSRSYNRLQKYLPDEEFKRINKQNSVLAQDFNQTFYLYKVNNFLQTSPKKTPNEKDSIKESLSPARRNTFISSSLVNQSIESAGYDLRCKTPIEVDDKSLLEMKNKYKSLTRLKSTLNPK